MNTKTVYVVQWWSKDLDVWMRTHEHDHETIKEARAQIKKWKEDGLTKRIVKRTEEVIE